MIGFVLYAWLLAAVGWALARGHANRPCARASGWRRSSSRSSSTRSCTPGSSRTRSPGACSALAAAVLARAAAATRRSAASGCLAGHSGTAGTLIVGPAMTGFVVLCPEPCLDPCCGRRARDRSRSASRSPSASRPRARPRERSIPSSTDVTVLGVETTSRSRAPPPGAGAGRRRALLAVVRRRSAAVARTPDVRPRHSGPQDRCGRGVSRATSSIRRATARGRCT